MANKKENQKIEEVRISLEIFEVIKEFNDLGETFKVGEVIELKENLKDWIFRLEKRNFLKQKYIEYKK